MEHAHLVIQDDAECDWAWAFVEARKLLPFVELGIVDLGLQDGLLSGIPPAGDDDLALM
jgi:hypothetical protein